MGVNSDLAKALWESYEKKRIEQGKEEGEDVAMMTEEEAANMETNLYNISVANLPTARGICGAKYRLRNELYRG